MAKIELPQIYTEDKWNISKNPYNRKYIGKQYVSWSQLESFNDKSGFNTGHLGEYEYILKYFSKIEFPDLGWGDFGSETEAYITLREENPENHDEKTKRYIIESLKNFSENEKKILHKIKPLGIFQDEICYYIENMDVVVLGYIDDRSPEINGKIKMLRDYKTKSENSKKDLHDDKKHQIELYILGLRQKGLEVENAEYCIIERLGGKECYAGGGRGVLSIGSRIWYEPYTWDEDRLLVTHNMICDSVIKISDYFKTYKRYF